jgi:DNA topoisomerase-1
MSDKLVIVESPAKSKTIGKILGPGYLVRSSMGHIRDLPVKTIGIDIEKNFTPKYVIVKGRTKVVDELKKAAQKADEIYLAPDPDREGEAIAWHLKELLGSMYENKKFFRIHYNEITAQAVKHAIANPGEIDLNMVNAQQARRVLDRLVGYKVSPLLWAKIRRGLSAGRVQTVALRLVCEREDEIRKFVSKDFWIIGAMLRKFVDPRDQFKVKLLRINDKKADVQSPAEADNVRNDLKSSAYVVGDIMKREVTRRPYPPAAVGVQRLWIFSKQDNDNSAEAL